MFASALILVVMGGCAAPSTGGFETAPSRAGAFAQRYRLELDVDPPRGFLRGRATIDVVMRSANNSHARPPSVADDGLRSDRQATNDNGSRFDRQAINDSGFRPDRESVTFDLHPALRVKKVRATGARVRAVSSATQPMTGTDSGLPVRRHVVTLARTGSAFTLFVDYEGALPGEPVNDALELRADARTKRPRPPSGVTPHGAWLADDRWHPRISPTPGSPPADFVVLASPIPQWEWVASAERDDQPDPMTGRVVWRTARPVESIAVVAGTFAVHEAHHRGVDIAYLTRSASAERAERVLSALWDAIDSFERWFGPFPDRQFNLVDATAPGFLSFPMLATLTAPADGGEVPSELADDEDHAVDETRAAATAALVQSWLGGACVGPCDDDWREPLAMHAFELVAAASGHADEVRDRRRRTLHDLSLLPCPLPPAGFRTGSKESAWERVAPRMEKRRRAFVLGMVFRQLEDTLFEPIARRFIEEHRGRPVPLSELTGSIVSASGRPRDVFPVEAIRGDACPPTVVIESATHRPEHNAVSVVVTQSAPPTEVRGVIRLHGPGGDAEVDVELSHVRQTLDIPVTSAPYSVNFDPDFLLLRRVPRDRVAPTLLSTLTSPSWTCVIEPRDGERAFQPVLEDVLASIEGTPRFILSPLELVEGALARRGVLVLGAAARAPYVSGFLSAVDFPVRFDDGGFEALDETYGGPHDAVVATIRHPGDPLVGVTVLYANSDSAVPSVDAILESEHSIVVFRRGRPIAHGDFDESDSVPVSRR